MSQKKYPEEFKIEAYQLLTQAGRIRVGAAPAAAESRPPMPCSQRFGNAPAVSSGLPASASRQRPMASKFSRPKPSGSIRA